LYCQTRRANELDQTRHELRPPTVALRSIVEIENQGVDAGKACLVDVPPVTENVRQTIAGDFGSHGIYRQFVPRRKQHTDRRHPRGWVEIMVGGMDVDAVLAATRILAHIDGGFGIYRKPQHALVCVRLWVDPAQLVEDGVGLGNLFLGRFFL